LSKLWSRAGHEPPGVIGMGIGMTAPTAHSAGAVSFSDAGEPTELILSDSQIFGGRLATVARFFVAHLGTLIEAAQSRFFTKTSLPPLDAEVGASPRLVSVVPWFMAKTSVVPKKKRGPAPTGKGVQVGERWHPSELAAIDAWIAASADKTLTRAHAIRRLVALGLKAKRK
jgi:hypothetical protein